MSFVIPMVFFDPPIVIDTRVTPIPASSQSPLQIVANTGKDTGVGIDYHDTTGDFIGVYIGAEGSEILLCMIGNGRSGQSWAKIPARSRLSIRSMKNVPITLGYLSGAVVTI